MRTQEALEHFGGRVRALADALGLSVQAIYAWGEEVPPLRAYQIRDILAQGKPEFRKEEKEAA